ncbi:hypothetical protein OPKNFCMD_6547 [Methylobacterium crusticola]|uniref:ABC transporter permease n=1 Tax=Methylobacterium crusticola TaxID=1697972 RepID=A0ABQ4R9I3_9HYPH|nr:hypothetical protein [Methylobacterium crusticola]GJD53769.1 hypothetical protein OPKNFCMD_6547 [Methylobacterium crusticola]
MTRRGAAGLIGRARSPLAIRLAFALAVLLATEPVWGLLAFGFSPTLDDLLALRCLGGDGLP